MISRFAVRVGIGLLMLALPMTALADEATDAFDSIYGADVKAVAATRDTADDLALARKLLKAARPDTTHPALAVVLCEKAHDLALKDPAGTSTAAEALRLAAGKAPDKKCEYLEKAVAIFQREYDAAPPAGRIGPGNLLIAALLDLAEAQADNADTAEKTLRRALAVANAASSPLRAIVQQKVDSLAALGKTEAQVKKLAATLEADPSNAAARSQIVRLYTVELNQPAEAARFLGDGVDETFRKYVPGAAKPPAEAPELACMELGEWYRDLATTASAAARPAMLKRAQTYYERFLELHDKEDVTRSQATLALNKVADELAKSAASTRPEATGAAAAGKKLPNGTWIDLIALTDPDQDCTDNRALKLWQRQGTGLVGQPSQQGPTSIACPVAIEGSYDLQVKFLRKQTYGYIYIHLPVGSRSVSLMLYSGRSGLSYVNGRSAYYNETGALTPFQVNRAYTVDIKVLTEGDDASIAVNLDGKALVRWKGPQAELSASTIRNRKQVGLAVYDTVTVFGAARLRMQSGTAQALRP